MSNEAQRAGKKSAERGFSMVEMLLAAVVLGVAILGGMAMIIIGIARNSGNRMDTTATNLAQTVLEDIASAPPTANAPLSITDCNQTPWAINTAAGGAALDPNTGDIDFSQPAVPGYRATYTECGTNGLLTTYDIRWNVQAVAGAKWAKLVTVAARQPLAVRNGTFTYTPPVTLRTIVGM